MTDDLDTLSDAELSDAFAREYLGWTCDALNRFATSADAVLPFIEKYTADTDERDGGEPMVFRIYTPADKNDVWTVEPWWMHHDGTIPFGEPGTGKTLARAACIALLRAKRAEKGLVP